MIRVDLTTADPGQAPNLRKHFQELKRRVRRRYGYDVDSFIVETSEGFGVLHMLWAIDSEKAAWIDQGFLSEEWQKIHGAFRVWIKRVRGSKADRRRVAKYLVSQYLVNQGESGSALVRYSYSWWKSRAAIGKAWTVLKAEFRMAQFRHARWLRTDQGQAPPVIFADLLQSWNQLLETGRCELAGVALCVYDRELMRTTEAAKKIFG